MPLVRKMTGFPQCFIKATCSNENHIQRNSYIQWWFQNTTPFYIERKRVGRELNRGETERERGRETECCYKRVAAWAMNLTVVQIFMTARERIIRDLINMNIKILLKNWGGYFSLGTLTFHLSSKLSICHTAMKSFTAQAIGGSGGIRTLDQRQ